jgi:septal ring factor EnvC (AmiA/AmiB activator)
VPGDFAANIRTLSGTVTLVVTIVGSAWGAADYIGGKIYSFAETQAKISDQLVGVQGQLIEARNSIAKENDVRAKALDDLKSDIAPKFETLGKAIVDTRSEAATAKQRVDDMNATLQRLVDLATRNLQISTAHDAKINSTADDAGAIRAMVAPKPGPMPRGQ